MKDLFKKVIAIIINIFPTRRRILFESSPDLSDNTYAYFKYLLDEGYNKKYKFIWLLNNSLNEYPKIHNVKYINRRFSSILYRLYEYYLISTSKYIIDCNVFVKPKRKSQIRIHLSHGMPVKYADDYCNSAGKIDTLLSTSDFFNEMFSELFLTDIDNVAALGYPRNDVLLQNNTDLKNNLFGNKKVIIWMPTYRQHKNVDVKVENIFPLGIPVLRSADDIKLINRVLQDNDCYLLLRLHPAQDLSQINISEVENIIIADDNYLKKNKTTLYRLLSCTDALITDYSSVYYDYLLTDNPIGLMTEDLDEFFSVFKCAYDSFEENIIGEYIYTVEEFGKFIKNISQGKDIKSTERSEKKILYHKYTTGSSSERLFNYMKEKYDF